MNPTKQTIAEVQRIARAERMLGEKAGPTLVKLLRDVGDACDLSIAEMHVSVKPDGFASPEPRTHFVITAAELRSTTTADGDAAGRSSDNISALLRR